MTTNNAVNVGLSGSTGTGHFVGGTAPTIATPIINAIYDTNSNTNTSFGTTASAVNYISNTNAATGGNPVIAGIGSDTNVILQLTGQGTGGIALHGTGTNDSAGSGYVGEVITSAIAAGSAVSVTTNTATLVTSISLTAGDWDVTGAVYYAAAGSTTSTAFYANIAESVALSSTYSYSALPLSFAAGNAPSMPLAPCVIKLASTTTVYLIAYATFTVSTMAAYGFITARRRR